MFPGTTRTPGAVLFGTARHPGAVFAGTRRAESARVRTRVTDRLLGRTFDS